MTAATTIFDQTPPPRPMPPRPDILIDRHELADEVVRFIVGLPGRVAVLHGRPSSGKSELLHKWVLPSLRAIGLAEGREVFYAECNPGLPGSVSAGNGAGGSLEDAAAAGGTLVLDAFERVFDLPRDDRRAQLDRLFALLERPGARLTTVFVTDTSHLTNVFTLAAHAPGLLGAVFELKSIGLGEGLRQLALVRPDEAMECSEEVLDHLDDAAAEMGDQGWNTTVELIQWVDHRLRELRRISSDPVLDLTRLHKLGDLEGMLASHLTGGLERLGGQRTDGRELGIAILERVLEARAQGTVPSFDDIPARVGVASEVMESTLAQLSGPLALLRRTPEGSYELTPAQVGVALERELAVRRGDVERTQRIVEEGLRGWRLLGTLLPRNRFEEVHRARAQLTLGGDEVRFIFQCALRREEGDHTTASQYWLYRMADREDAADILMSCLFNEIVDVRLRATALLQEFPEPDARERLRVVALTDRVAEVRARAVATLAVMPDQALLESLVQEVNDGKSSHRGEAIEALSIFPRDAVVALLKSLVNDRATAGDLRRRATRVLSVIDSPASVQALLDIGLEDEDADDRQAAAEALASIRSVDHNQMLLRGLRAPSLPTRLRATGAALSAAALLGALLLVSTLLVTAYMSVAFRWLAVLFGLLSLPFVRRTMLALRAGTLRRGSSRAVAGTVLLVLHALSTGFVLHGLASCLLGRWRRGLSLLGLEAVSILLLVAAVWLMTIQPVFGSIYLIVGSALWIGSYLYDVVGALLGTVVLAGAIQRDQRGAAIYRRILGNPVVARLAFESLKSPDSGTAQWASEVVTRFGGSVEPAVLIELLQAQDQDQLPYVRRALQRCTVDETVRRLETLWHDGDPALRPRIAGILAGHPSERSLDVLGRLKSDMGPWLKLRTGVARWHYGVMVWPRAARYSVALAVLTVPYFVFHGTMALTHHAWSQVVTLKRPWLASESEEIKAAGILSDYYGDEASQVLPDLFIRHVYAHKPLVTAAVARGMVGLLVSDDTRSDATTRDRVLQNAKEIEEALLLGDSVTFARAVSDLGSLSASADSGYARDGLGLLQGLVIVSGPLEADNWKRLAIEAIAAMDYRRALPALDSLYRIHPIPDPLGPFLSKKIEDVATNAHANIAQAGLWAADGRELDAALTRMRYKPSPVVATLEQLKKEIAKTERRRTRGAVTCDRNQDDICDERDRSLDLIAANPDKEDPFRDLLGHYIDDGQSYPAAARTFLALKQQYPRAVWPRKILAELYHEYLSRDDTVQFYRSFDESVELRSLPAYRALAADTATWDRVETDFAEVALSARRYDVLATVASQVLSHSESPVRHLNLGLFLYMSAVMQGDRAAATARLEDLAKVVATLPKDFYNTWQYPGTVVFVQMSSLPKPLRDALLLLCKEGYWYEPAAAQEVIGENRAALQYVGTGSLRR